MFWSLLFALPCFGQNTSIEKIPTDSLVRKGLNYLYDAQQKETVGTTYFKGEWKSFITNECFFPMLIKKGKKADDSNCFTTASVHNLLAEIYLSHPNYDIIPKMLAPAYENIMQFRNNGIFNFWHYLNRAENLQKKKHKLNPEKYMQFRPNNFYFKSRFYNNCTNVCNDADDTALGFMVMKLNKKAIPTNSNNIVPDSIGTYFSSYRNIDRKKTHFYNFFFSKRENIKGAFCTWFGKETGYTGIGFLPFASKQKQYIPYNTNEVDCIVNSNILLALYYYNEMETPGVKEAIRMLKNIVTTNRCNDCGIYYPTEFTLHYIVSQLINKGITDFNDNIPEMLDRVARSQRDDGSFKTDIKGNELQSTLYALLTMCNIGQVEKYNTLPLIEKAMSYVLSQAVEKDNQIYWNGGVFFSGGTVVRDVFLWRSDAITTTLAITAILKYDEIKKIQNNLRSN